MFWKKKKKVDLEVDSRHEDSRSAFRIAPDKSNPVILTIQGRSYHALNISGSGVCFRSNNFPVGTKCTAMVRLPSKDKIFPVNLEIVDLQRDLCRCRFINIHPEAENLLHSYILELQKGKIRKNISR
ncbi:MAG: PilZ domain-containing protein [Gammaproteobacteria bacterium]|nr:PilZ domain-containing protein [Gammaproteobacteria bacterium]